MKRTLSICLGLLAFSLLPLMAQQAPAPAAPVEAVGKVQGQVINPTGNPQGGGTVSLSADGGATDKFSFRWLKTAPWRRCCPGTYLMVYRAADTPKGQMVDSVKGVKVVSGQTLNQNIDMSRQEFIDTMSPEQKKQLEELKSKNSEAMKANQVINHLNADLKVLRRIGWISMQRQRRQPVRWALGPPRPTSRPRRTRSRPRSTPTLKA